MNPIDVYKKLPGINCGKCSQKTCMPFAFALLKGDAAPSDCPHLTEEQKKEMESSIRKSDWREDLILNLKEVIKKVRFDDAAKNLGAELINGKLRMRCFFRDVVVSADGEIESTKMLTPRMRIPVLFYIKNGGGHGLSGKWVLHNELPGGLMKFNAFQRECEEPLRALFDKHFENTVLFLNGYGVEQQEEFATQNAWLLYVFPKLPVLFLYWPRNDEFESQLIIRFDSRASECFDVEQLVFLVAEILKDIENEIGI